MDAFNKNLHRKTFTMKKRWLFFVLIVITQTTFAQLDTTNNEVFTIVSTVQKPYEALKIDIVNWLSGNSMISFEQQTSKYLGYEVGVGLLTPAYVDPLVNLMALGYPALNKTLGMGYSALYCPKVYWDGVYDLYTGLPVQLMLFPGEAMSLRLFGEAGYQWKLGHRWTIACSLGIGFMYQYSFHTKNVYPVLSAGPPFSIYDLHPFVKGGLTVGFGLN